MSESLHAPIGARVISPEGWASGWTRSLRQGGGGTGEPATFKVLIGTIFGIPKGRDAVAASLTKRIGA